MFLRISYIQVIFKVERYIKQGCSKIMKTTAFCDTMHHIKTMWLDTKLFSENLKVFLLRNREN